MQRPEFITFLGAAAAERAKRPTALLREAGYLLLGLVSLATVTGLYFWLDVPLVAAAFTYLVVLVLLSLVSNFSSLIVLSFIGVCCLSYFFAPPIYSFRVDYAQDLITISAFVITSFVVNFLVTRVRDEQRDHMRTCETLRDANQRLEVTNEALRIENVERKGAEHALRESEANFRDYAETASDWFWEIGPHYKFTLLTENAFGSHAAARIGTACWDHALDLETEPEKWRLIRATLDSRKPFRDFVYRGLSGSGSPMYVKASGKPVFDANGEFHGYRGTGTDVTALMRAQEQQTAISEVLRAIANSPHDLQPIFDAILDSATRLCRADSGALRLSEEGGLRLVAVRGDPLLVSQVWSSIPVLAEKGSLPDRLAASRLPTHIPDFTAVEGDHRDDFCIRVVNAGIRTGLFVPLLKDNEIVGIISLTRKQVQPFTDKQISLFRDFAAQATIALESIRRERQYREAQMALAHANIELDVPISGIQLSDRLHREAFDVAIRGRRSRRTQHPA
jgi:GAF domain-containing protein